MAYTYRREFSRRAGEDRGARLLEHSDRHLSGHGGKAPKELLHRVVILRVIKKCFDGNSKSQVQKPIAEPVKSRGARAGGGSGRSARSTVLRVAMALCCRV